MRELSDEELMECVKSDDPKPAFSELMRRYESRLVNFLNRYTGDRESAENLAQETFLRIYRTRNDYEPSAKFKTYIYRIATNLAIDEFRRKARKKEDLVDDFSQSESSAPNPHEKAVQGDRAEQVRQSLMKLDEKHRAVVVMKWFDGMKYEQIAKVLGISVGTVKSRIHYALKQLEVELKPLLNGDS